MRRIAAVFLLILTACLSSGCGRRAPLVVTPTLAIPARPDLLPVVWRQEGNLHCLTEGDARNLYINVTRLRTHIDVLEGYIRAVSDEADQDQ